MALLSFEEVYLREPDLSDDEDLPPEQAAFTGLFPPALFKSLLFKAVNTAQLASTEMIPPTSRGSLDPMFAELTKPVDSIPVPLLFLGSQKAVVLTGVVHNTINC